MRMASKFRFVGPRLQVRGVTFPIGMGEPLCGRVDRTSKLRVYQQWQTSPRNMREGCSQILLGNHGETVDPGMDQKAFESKHTGRREGFDICLIVMDHATPRRPIYPALAMRCGTLRFECSDRRRRREAVQRHVHQQRVASCRRGAGCGLETFPLGSSGLVDVNVRIHQPGKNRASPKSCGSWLSGTCRYWDNGLNLFSFHQYGCRLDAFRGDYSPGNEGLRIHRINRMFREGA